MRKVLKLFLTLVLLMPMCFMVVGCDKNKDPETPPGGGGGNPPAAPIATIDNFEVKSLKLYWLHEDYFSFEVGVTNVGAETAEFDFSKIVLKLGETEITHNASSKEYSAGQYYKWAFSIDPGQGLQVGQNIDFYYEDTFLKTIKIVEF